MEFFSNIDFGTTIHLETLGNHLELDYLNFVEDKCSDSFDIHSTDTSNLRCGGVFDMCRCPTLACAAAYNHFYYLK
jgi:hypothetical protein